MSIKKHFFESMNIECDEDLLILKDSIDYVLSIIDPSADLQPIIRLAAFSHKLSGAIKKHYENLIKENKVPQL